MKKKQEKTLFTIQIPPDSPPEVADVNQPLFDVHLTKKEFNHFLVANLNQIGQVLAGLVNKIVEQDNRIKELEDAKDK